MSYPGHTPFKPIGSFNTTLGSTSQFYALDSTAFGLHGSAEKKRAWGFPGPRQIRVASLGTDDYYVAFGTTTVVAGSTDSMLVLGGSAELFTLPAVQSTGLSYIAIASSTDVVANVTIGHGA